MKRRIMCLLLTLLFLATLLPLPQAEAAHLRVSLSDLREKFPNGTYWNHHSGYNNPNGYSTTPCGICTATAITTAAAAATPLTTPSSAWAIPISSAMTTTAPP